MKHRISYVMLSVFIGVAAITLLVTAAWFAASGVRPLTLENNQNSSHLQNDAIIIARRKISVPFGIDDFLSLSLDTGTTTVTGHGDCIGGETYHLKVTVSQPSLDGLAVGFLDGDCASDGQFSWSTDVYAPSPDGFSPGSAQACGHVVVFFDQEGAIVYDWCKPVTLQ